MSEAAVSTEHPLAPLRSQIDEIDAQLLQLLARRFVLTDEVGHYKAQQGLPPVDAEREAAQMVRIAERATALQVDPQLAQQWFRLVIDRVVQRHREIADQQHPVA
ncbi:chorismate mutase [Andreprevotia lacus DSM 23236]|jgi:chorismate mutase|uniref:chorismate mutase n=1 Tax=Andreprevotia lacus DSM 23236 TaxID=1121001 RepID=A0A1W1XT02_9NEIS|nr:chorismate mutase [Andreprevotia lacus]SMC26965.1 chorismate mutase [Andreprevotia lacus DSM 23236]